MTKSIDPTEAERLGREAVELGWDWPDRTRSVRVVNLPTCRLAHGTVAALWKPTGDVWPDFNDELTALACIPWVRSAWGVTDEGWLQVTFDNRQVDILISDKDERCLYEGDDHPTIAHACIAAVRAFRETK